MSDSSKDPGIKLFGKTIQLPDIQSPASETGSPFRDGVDAPAPSCGDASARASSRLRNDPAEGGGSDGAGEDEPPHQDQQREKLDANGGSQSLMEEELTDHNENEMEVDGSKTTKKPVTYEQGETSNSSSSQDKALKKPDKILPCPRCNSMETKFCYFNNYNVNQPRHFCKNCQRYWTAGGTMRNVPVGAGRRKNKPSGPHYRHVTIPESFPGGRVDQKGINPHHNGTLLAFGSESPLCESMASGLNIAEKKVMAKKKGSENGDDHSSGSSVTAAVELPDRPNCPNLVPQMPCFPGAPWPYPLAAVQWTPPGYCATPVYPAPPFWGCPVPWVGGQPPIAPQCHIPSSLGKHSRDENENSTKPVTSEEEEESKKEGDPEKCLWVPKTLRVDDPEDAAKSSIWATLGIKNHRVNFVGEGAIFKAFQMKEDEKTDSSENSTVLQGNPAALSRSLIFHENSH